MASLWGGAASPYDLHVLYDASTAPLPGSIAPCLLCAKPFLMRPSSGAPDQTCPECAKTYLDCALLVCQGCNCVVGRVVPKLLDCGYYVRPKNVLHTDACSVCRPGLEQSTILEIQNYMVRRGSTKLIVIPTMTQVERIAAEQKKEGQRGR